MSFVNVEWREIPGFPRYEITSLGLIRRKVSKEPQAINYTGATETVQLTCDGKRYHRTVTSVVKAAFPGVLYP